MTDQYKVGDRVLVEAEIDKIHSYGVDFKMDGEAAGYCYFDTIYSHAPTDIDGNVLRPGDECEFWNDERVKSISCFKYCEEEFFYGEVRNKPWVYCRKITKPKTIEFDGKTYNADDVRERLKDLKPVEGK